MPQAGVVQANVKLILCDGYEDVFINIIVVLDYAIGQKEKGFEVITKDCERLDVVSYRLEQSIIGLV